MTLSDSLDALLQEHDRIGSPLRGQLVPGPGPDAVRRAIEGQGLTAHQEVVELFSWRDVAVKGERTGLFWPATSYRLPEALEHYRWAVREAGVTAPGVDAMLADGSSAASTFTGFWRTDWLPWLMGDPEEYAIECGTGNREAGPVWRVNWHPDADFETTMVAPSVRDFVDRIVSLFRAGAYEWAPRHASLVPVDEVFERLGLGAHLRP